MSIDYDQLRNLRDKATPGPWEFREDQEWEHVAGPEYPPMLIHVEHTVWGSDGETLFGNFNDTVLEEHPGNLPLAALAPAMAAELIRLRDGVEKLREMCLRERNAAFHATPMLAGEVGAFNVCADQLTDLLEGDNK